MSSATFAIFHSFVKTVKIYESIQQMTMIYIIKRVEELKESCSLLVSPWYIDHLHHQLNGADRTMVYGYARLPVLLI